MQPRREGSRPLLPQHARHCPVLEAGSALGRFTSHEWIGSVDVPTPVVLTELDRVVPPERQRKLAAAIPGAA